MSSLTYCPNCRLYQEREFCENCQIKVKKNKEFFFFYFNKSGSALEKILQEKTKKELKEKKSYVFEKNK